MPTTDQPLAAVPPRLGAGREPRALDDDQGAAVGRRPVAARPAARTARRPVGQYGSAERRRGRRPRRSRSGPGSSCGRRAGRGRPACRDRGAVAARRPRTGASTWRTPSERERPEVRPVGDAVRREPVVAPVPREEGDPAAGDLADDDRVGRRSVRRLDHDLLGVVEERVEPGAAQHPDLGGGVWSSCRLRLAAPPGIPSRSSTAHCGRRASLCPHQSGARGQARRVQLCGQAAEDEPPVVGAGEVEPLVLLTPLSLARGWRPCRRSPTSRSSRSSRSSRRTSRPWRQTCRSPRNP